MTRRENDWRDWDDAGASSFAEYGGRERSRKSKQFSQGGAPRDKKNTRARKDRKELSPKALWESFAAEALQCDTASRLVPNAKQLVLFGCELYALPEDIPLGGMRVLRPGLHLGSVKKDRFEPSHALALALSGGDAQQTFSMQGDGAEAAAFLRGESIVSEAEYRGWVLMLVDGYSIGWAKAAGTMLKNHYPKGLRKQY